MNMKSNSNASSGPHTSHPIAAAAQALAEAVVNAQRAIDAARTEPSPEKIALAACRRECDALQVKNTALIASSRTQLQEINRLQMRCEGLAADRDLETEQANAGDRQIVGLHARLTATEAQLTSTEAALHQQRTAAERSRVELEHSAAREAALEEDLARLDRVRGTLARSRSRSAVKALKRSVELLIVDHERALEEARLAGRHPPMDASQNGAGRLRLRRRELSVRLLIKGNIVAVATVMSDHQEKSITSVQNGAALSVGFETAPVPDVTPTLDTATAIDVGGNPQVNVGHIQHPQQESRGWLNEYIYGRLHHAAEHMLTHIPDRCA
ncbi:hypothetical protein B0H14DRAFT_3160049 [Mycena olivaceomarginata]|nr:hypothetical protein B0H14DRAFT_3160049 [Mycena olivaceomarginata]